MCRQADGFRTGIAGPTARGRVPGTFLPSNTHSGAFELARNLLLAGVGQPEDWERSKGDPVAFMLHTMERAAAAFNRKTIDAIAHTDFLFGTGPCVFKLAREGIRRSGSGVPGG